MNTLFPVFLKTEHLRFLIVGAGNVGLEKLSTLCKQNQNTKIRIVAPEIKSEIYALASTMKNVTLIAHKFEASHLKKIDLAIICTESLETNIEIQKLCKSKKILVNVADTPDLCDFYLGSIVNKGDLKIAVSTNGKSPTFAKRFREMLEDILPNNIQAVLNNLNEIRNSLKGDFQSKVDKLNEITEVLKKEQP